VITEIWFPLIAGAALFTPMPIVALAATAIVFLATHRNRSHFAARAIVAFGMIVVAAVLISPSSAAILFSPLSVEGSLFPFVHFVLIVSWMHGTWNAAMTALERDDWLLSVGAAPRVVSRREREYQRFRDAVLPHIAAAIRSGATITNRNVSDLFDALMGFRPAAAGGRSRIAQVAEAADWPPEALTGINSYFESIAGAPKQKTNAESFKLALLTRFLKRKRSRQRNESVRVAERRWARRRRVPACPVGGPNPRVR
jgi:hypothetical protein